MTDETEHDRPLAVARYDAFISYAREDNTAATGFVVDRLREVLSTRGKQVWVDVRYIPGGADWRERIRPGVEAFKAFMFIVSPDSVASEACRDELCGQIVTLAPLAGTRSDPGPPSCVVAQSAQER